jgi:hypothetical protein
VIVHCPLPSSVLRKFRRYTFERVAHHLLTQKYPKWRTLRVYESRAEEKLAKQRMLQSTLLSNLCLTAEFLWFVQDFHDAADWVKARVPADSWARLKDSTESVLRLELEEGYS